MAVVAERKTVGTSAAVLVQGDSDGSNHIVRNRGAVSIFLGGSDVTTSTGFEVEAGTTMSFDLDSNEACYAISGTAGQTVHTWRNRA